MGTDEASSLYEVAWFYFLSPVPFQFQPIVTLFVYSSVAIILDFI
jgi:hypothetical protein